jgi:calcium-dependent protein kinase
MNKRLFTGLNVYLNFISDLKPENIIFATKEKDSPIKIIDFGTSRKFSHDKKMTKILGTVDFHSCLITKKPYYIAPEVLN